MGINRKAYLDLINKQDIKFKNYPSEAEVQLSIIKYLRARGFACGKIKTKGSFASGKYIFDLYQFRGLPDLLIFTSIRMYFVEVKSFKGELTEEQRDFQKLCNNINIPYIIAKSINDVKCII